MAGVAVRVPMANLRGLPLWTQVVAFSPTSLLPTESVSALFP